MKLKLESNQSVFDVGLMLNGTLDNLLIDTLSKYGFIELDQDLTNVEIDAIYNTDNQFVNNIFIDKRKVVTSIAGEQEDIQTWSFSNGFNKGFDIYLKK